MIALQVLQISKCFTMWPKLTQCYNVQDGGSAQSGNNLLGLIKAAHSQVSWSDIKGRMQDKSLKFTVCRLQQDQWANSYLDV